MQTGAAIQDTLSRLTAALEIKREVVGVKFFVDQAAFDAVDGKRLSTKMPYCVMVKVAAAGAAVKATLENLSCNGARNVLGLTEPLPTFLAGESGMRLGLYCDQNVAHEAAAKLSRIKTRSYGMQIMPLRAFTAAPDLVIIVTSAYNVMRLMQGYGYHYGVKKSCSISGNQAFCSELTAEPMTSGEPNISMLCSGTRFWCGWRKDELGIGIPYQQFDAVVDGVMKTLNVTEPLSDKQRIEAKFAEEGIAFPVDTSRSYYHTYRR